MSGSATVDGASLVPGVLFPPPGVYLLLGVLLLFSNRETGVLLKLLLFSNRDTGVLWLLVFSNREAGVLLLLVFNNDCAVLFCGVNPERGRGRFLETVLPVGV